jgi:CDP-diacylglycerol pyrophosphatase
MAAISPEFSRNPGGRRSRTGDRFSPIKDRYYSVLVTTKLNPLRFKAKRKRRWQVVAGAFAFLAGMAAIGIVRGAEREALWMVVRLCVLDKAEFDRSAPCAAVDLSSGEATGSAVLKDIIGKTQFLLIPTRRVTGIEDPLLETPATPNYWRAAWAARNLVSERVGKELPRDAIGMAINGAGARSQDQLHIHIDCIRPDVLTKLQARAAQIPTHWTDFTMAGHTYRARRIDGEELEPDPFLLLAEDTHASGGQMREETLAVMGARLGAGRNGFILLAERIASGRGHAEDLLDHACAVAAR